MRAITPGGPVGPVKDLEPTDRPPLAGRSRATYRTGGAGGWGGMRNPFTRFRRGVGHGPDQNVLPPKVAKLSYNF